MGPLGGGGLARPTMRQLCCAPMRLNDNACDPSLTRPPRVLALHPVASVAHDWQPMLSPLGGPPLFRRQRLALLVVVLLLRPHAPIAVQPGAPWPSGSLPEPPVDCNASESVGADESPQPFTLDWEAVEANFRAKQHFLAGVRPGDLVQYFQLVGRPKKMWGRVKMYVRGALWAQGMPYLELMVFNRRSPRSVASFPAFSLKDPAGQPRHPMLWAEEDL